jgi:ADP-ribose pyrophosphatase YjhB (NUDIX family)
MRKHNAGVTTPRIRVAAYVIRHRTGTGPELLVFDHLGMPEAGTQIPAGGVAEGEPLEEAVLREVAEETGVLTATVVRQLAVEDKPHPGTGRPRRTTFFHLRLDAADAPDEWEHHVRGDGEDAGLTFVCRFLPLPLTRPLADHQNAWLDRIDPLWATGAGEVPDDGTS